MRPGAIKVETKGSFFWISEATMEYARLPKQEAPRERPEWSDHRAGVLQDAVWHPMVSWRIAPHPEDQGRWEAAQTLAEQDPERFWMFATLPVPEPGLIIICGNEPFARAVWAPNARIIE